MSVPDPGAGDVVPIVFRGSQTEVEELTRRLRSGFTAPRAGHYRLTSEKGYVEVSETRKPNVGDIVHYVSYGTPGGEYTSECRAAVVAEVGQWITVETKTPESFDRSEGRPIREAEQWWYADACALVVLNPSGMFFNGCRHDESLGLSDWVPGTWHWAGHRQGRRADAD